MSARTTRSLLGTSALLVAGLLASPAGAGDCPFELGALGSGVTPNWNGVLSIGTFDDGVSSLLIVGGEFTIDGGLAVNIASWDGEVWGTLGSGVNATPRSMLTWDDGTGPALYVGGDFTAAGGMPAWRVARWDGFEWSSLGTGINGQVWSLEIFDDGSGPALYAAGHFTVAGGQPASGVARWDGQQWTALGGGITGIGPGEMDLEVFDDGSGPALYVGGKFTTAGGQPANNIAKWDGAAWSALDSGVTGAILELEAHDDGSGADLYVGGQITEAGGETVSGVTKWDGSSWSAVGNLVPNTAVWDLVSFDSGSSPAQLYGVATFAQKSFIVLDDGVFVAAEPTVSGREALIELHSHDDGSGPALYFGGFFFNTNFGGVTLNHVGKWYRPCLASTRILVQPQPELLPPSGAPAQFFVSATGFALSYEWTLDGVVIEDGGPFSGATTALLTVAAASPELTTGFYRCRVINGVGSTTLTNRVSLARRPSCPGDANGDGEVNLADLNLILSRFGHVCP